MLDKRWSNGGQDPKPKMVKSWSKVGQKVDKNGQLTADGKQLTAYG
jgi:hypothetical protein